MAEGCHLVAPDSFIVNVLTGEENTQSLTEIEKKELKSIADRFHELLVRDFVGCNAGLKYCPYPGCTNTVSCPSAASKFTLTQTVPTVSCGARGIISDPKSQEVKANGKQSSQSSSSGLSNPLSLAGREHKFCFGCPIEGDHRPVVCSVAKMWLKKCRDDSETANWIKSNTKECSQCQSTIEKNGGCK
jgi:ariadne-1